MSRRHAAALAAALLGACIAPSHATTVALAVDGRWNTFNVNELDARSFGVEWIDNANTLAPGFGTPLEFGFSIAPGSRGTLTVVDAGFAGDTYTLVDSGRVLGRTSAVPLRGVAGGIDVGTDFDAALANAAFSRGVFEFGAGSHLIGGSLAQSVTFDGAPLNATVGALRLVVSPVPEPANWLLFAAGLATLALASRQGRR